MRRSPPAILLAMRLGLTGSALAFLLACTHAPRTVSTTPISPHGGGGFSVPTPLPVCPFRIGDSVIRAGGGAVVPEPGRGVIGNFDGVNQSGSINIDTSLDGVVTIKSQITGQPETVEYCQLPSSTTSGR
jgi:hypothetical protein